MIMKFIVFNVEEACKTESCHISELHHQYLNQTLTYGHVD
jgi:hypothetical protein